MLVSDKATMKDVIEWIQKAFLLTDLQISSITQQSNK